MSPAPAFWKCLLACLLLWGPTAAATPTPTLPPGTRMPDYAVALLLNTTPSEMKRHWQLVLNQLTNDTGLHFHLRFYEDVASFENSLMLNETDFALLGPLQVWKLRSRYQPHLRSRLPLTSAVIVLENSSLNKLSDLKGRPLGLQEGANHSANVLVLRELNAQKTEPELTFVRTESNALRAVIMGKIDAAIVDNFNLKALPPEIVAQVKIIYRSRELPAPAFVANLSLPPETIEKVKKSLLRLQKTHAQLLDAVLLPDLTEADLNQDYADIGKALTSEADNARP